MLSRHLIGEKSIYIVEVGVEYLDQSRKIFYWDITNKIFQHCFIEVSRPTKTTEPPPYFLYSYGIGEMTINPKRKDEMFIATEYGFDSRLSDGKVLGTPHLPSIHRGTFSNIGFNVFVCMYYFYFLPNCFIYFIYLQRNYLPISKLGKG